MFQWITKLDNKFKESEEELPEYDINSKDIVISVGFATLLFSATIGTMLALVQTDLAFAFLNLLYNNFVGAVVVGGTITIGTVIGKRGMINNNVIFSLLGILILIGIYGLLGASIMSMYFQSVYTQSILLSIVVLLIITVIVSVYVLTSERKSYTIFAVLSVIPFMFSGIFSFIGTYIYKASFIFELAGVFSIIGFFLYFIYEVGITVRKNYNPLANGFGLYVAASGIFIHILRLVLRMKQ